MAEMMLSAIRGDTEVYTLTLLDGETPMDLDGSDIVFSAKRRLADSEFVFQRSVGDGIEVDGAGEITVTIEPEDTAELPPHTAYLAYDIQVTTDGVVKTPLRGKLRVIPDVSAAVVS